MGGTSRVEYGMLPTNIQINSYIVVCAKLTTPEIESKLFFFNLISSLRQLKRKHDNFVFAFLFACLSLCFFFIVFHFSAQINRFLFFVAHDLLIQYFFFFSSYVGCRFMKLPLLNDSVSLLLAKRFQRLVSQQRIKLKKLYPPIQNIVV